MDRPLRDSIIGSLLWAAYGDALGFMTELADRSMLTQRTGLDTVLDTVPWTYRVGGRYGVFVKMPAGAYSDDTQLRLATARALRTGGRFDVDAFAKVELPVWLAYALGGGRGTKASAVNLTKDNISWFANFYGSGDTNYVGGGGNGAAMRIQPHVWACAERPDYRDISLNVLRNAVCTHGHPRALVGALLHAHLLARTFTNREVPGPAAWREEVARLAEIPDVLDSDDYLGRMWLPEWERQADISFGVALREVADECKAEINAFESLGDASPTERYLQLLEVTDARNPQHRGSGTKSVFLASALAWLFREAGPLEAMRVAANALGSDTDTIATMAGAVLGVLHTTPPPGRLADEELLLAEADRMYRLAVGEEVEPFPYPSLLGWKPPKTASDAFGNYGNGVAVAGLGPVELVDGQTYQSKDSAWRWVTTRYGQTLLVKSRQALTKMPESMVAKYWSEPAKAPSTAPARPERPNQEAAASRRGREPERDSTRTADSKKTEQVNQHPRLFDTPPVQRTMSGARSADDVIQMVVESDFAPEVIGECLLKLIHSPDGIERSVYFAAVIAQLAKSRRR